jgi:hypothetical protein
MDMEATELSIRRMMHGVGGLLLEKLLNADTDVDDVVRPCGDGHSARFMGCRSKEVVTVLATVKVQRAYYHCKDCSRGFFSKRS